MASNWPAATPAPGPSPQRHRLPLLPASVPGIGGGVGGSGERGMGVCVGGDASDEPPPLVRANSSAFSLKRSPRKRPRAFVAWTRCSSFEVKPLEGQTQPVDLVKAICPSAVSAFVRSTNLGLRTPARVIENKPAPERKWVHGDIAPIVRTPDHN